MSANLIWIAGYFGPVAGASPVWIAPGDGTVPSAVQSEIVSYYAPVAGATAVWIAGFFAPPPAAIGATPITISGWGGSGGSGPPPVTSVWSAADATANSMTLSNGGLTVVATTGAWGSVRGTNSKTSGKWYVEFLLSAASNHSTMLGVASSGFNASSYLGTSTYSTGLMIFQYGSSYESAGFTNNYKPQTTTGVVGDVIGLAIDFATGSIWLSRNGSWSALIERAGDPVTGANPMVSFVPATVGALFPGVSIQAGGGTWTLQSTAASQKYAAPSGFKAWDAP